MIEAVVVVFVLACYAFGTAWLVRERRQRRAAEERSRRRLHQLRVDEAQRRMERAARGERWP